jgi:hypothetical protein
MLQNHDVNVANRSFENVTQFGYLGAAVTDENFIEEEIKRRLRSGNVCYYSIPDLLLYLILVMLANIKSMIFCLLICCLKP